MATATATFTLSAFPNGVEHTLSHIRLHGTIAVSASPDTYATNGIPVSFVGTNVYTQIAPFTGQLHGTSGYQYYFDPVHQTIRFYLAGVETSNGASIPAAVHGDTIYADMVTTRS